MHRINWTWHLLQTFNGKKWEKFNSEKVASLAYARIQGRSALIAHFQNSSLMNEDKWCRPMLFHKDGPNAGDQVWISLVLIVYTKYTIWVTTSDWPYSHKMIDMAVLYILLFSDKDTYYYCRSLFLWGTMSGLGLGEIGRSSAWTLKMQVHQAPQTKKAILSAPRTQLAVRPWSKPNH